VAIAVAPHHHIGIQFFLNVFMGCGHQGPHLSFRHHAPQVVCQHSSRRPIQKRGKLVDHQARLIASSLKSQGNPQPGPLTI